MESVYGQMPSDRLPKSNPAPAKAATARKSTTPPASQRSSHRATSQKPVSSARVPPAAPPAAAPRQPIAQRSKSAAVAEQRADSPSAFVGKPQDALPGLDALEYSDPDKVEGPSHRRYISRTCFVFRPAALPRKLCIYFVESKYFEPVILTTILCNCLTMAWESPLDPEGTIKSAFINVCELVYLAIFTAEMLAKIMAYGLMGHKSAYLNDSWCQLDFVVVTLAWMPILFPGFGNYSVLRSFRALRPLRALRRLPGMPVLVRSILAALPRVGSVVLLCAFIMIVFAIVGVEVFKGKLHNRCASPGFDPEQSIAEQGVFDTEISCNPLLPDAEQCPSGSSCAYFKQNPENGMMSFDSVPFSMVTLLQALTFDDWTVAMFALMRAASGYSVIYFLLIVTIGGFFAVNLFLAVIFEEFISAQKMATEEEKEEAEQALAEKEALESAQGTIEKPKDDSIVPPASLPPPEGVFCCGPATSGFQLWLAEVVSSEAFNYVSAAIVVLNMFFMCLPYYGMSDEYAKTLETSSDIFTNIFIVEMLLKIYGLGCAGYWSDQWNALDGTIVSLNIGEKVLEFLFSKGTGVNMSFLRIIRMIRVLRVLRLMRSWKSLYKIIMTFGKAMSLMSNLFILMVIFMVIFSLLAMQLFGGKFDEDAGFSTIPCPGGLCADPELSPHPRMHFDYFIPAMITVFTVMTGEWIDAMAVAIEATDVWACFYYIGVVLVGRYLIMNLLIAIVLSAFSDDVDDIKGTTQAPDPAEFHRNVSRDQFRLASKRTPIAPVKEDDAEDEGLTGKPCFSLRGACKAIVSHPLFDNIIILAIIVSCLCLALDSPRLDPESELHEILHFLDDNFWPWLFLGEMLLKIFAFGFACSEGAYINSPWNQLDFVIVVGSFVAFAGDVVPELQYMTNIRVLRVLRPLRLVSKNEGMKLVLTSLFKTMPAVSNVVAVVFVIQVVFAIMGMQLYSGAMSSCTNPSLLTQQECVPGGEASARHARALKGGGGGDRVWDGTGPVLWLHDARGSFDNFGSSMLLLYVMSTGDEWQRHMFTMMDSAGAGKAPKRFDSSPDLFFSIVWMFVGSFFAMNLFVGVVVDEFNRIKRETDGTATMTKEQQQWVNTMRALVTNKPIKVARVPTNPIRNFLYNVVTSDRFDGFIMFIIMVVVGVMACDYWGIENDPGPYYLFNKATELTAYFFYGEFILKIVALGVDGYFADGWCRFDFVLVCTTLVDQFASEWLKGVIPVNAMLLRVLRVIRILRILRVLKRAKDLRNLILTMLYSFPSLINVCGILTLIMFMYAVLGVDLFTFVKHGENIDDQRNFDTLPNAFLLLFQCLTTDAWSGLMADAMASEERGECSAADKNCGNPGVAVTYFMSFQIIGSFVFLNLVVAIILENFTTIGSQDSSLVQTTDIDLFQETWAEKDPDADNYIDAMELPDLLLKLPPPLGLKGFASKSKAVRVCVNLNVKLHAGGQVEYHEVLDKLVRFNFKKKGYNPDEFASKLSEYIPPQPPSPPPPVLSPAKQAAETQSPAEKLVRKASEGMDASQAFALDVIARYTSNIRRWKKRAVGADKSQRRANQRLVKARKALDAAASAPAAAPSAEQAAQIEAAALEGEWKEPRQPWAWPMGKSKKAAPSTSMM